MDASKGGFQLFAPSVVEISKVVERSQRLRKVDQGQAGVEDAADEVDDEHRGEGTGLLRH